MFLFSLSSCTLGYFIKIYCSAFIPEPISLSTHPGNITRQGNRTDLSVTDIVTKEAAFLLIDSFGLVTHILVAIQTAKFLEIAALLEKYVISHPPTKVKLFNSWTNGELIHNLFFLTYMTVWAYSTYSELKDRVVFLSLYLIGGYHPPVWGYTILYFVTFSILQYSVWFLHMQIFFPASLIEACLAQMVTEIKERSKDTAIFEGEFITSKSKIKSISWTVMNRPNLSYGSDHVFWTSLSARYIQIENIVAAFQTFSGPYVIISLLFSVASSICVIYVGTMSELVWSSSILSRCMIEGTVATASYRVSAITNVGEMLKEKYAKVRKEVAISRHNFQERATHFNNDEQEEVRNICEFLGVNFMKNYKSMKIFSSKISPDWWTRYR